MNTWTEHIGANILGYVLLLLGTRFLSLSFSLSACVLFYYKAVNSSQVQTHTCIHFTYINTHPYRSNVHVFSTAWPLSIHSFTHSFIHLFVLFLHMCVLSLLKTACFLTFVAACLFWIFFTVVSSVARDVRFGASQSVHQFPHQFFFLIISFIFVVASSAYFLFAVVVVEHFFSVSAVIFNLFH